MKLNYLLALSLSLGLILTSCGSGEDPEINITAPAEGSTYAAGDVINFTGTATDDEQVTGVRFEGVVSQVEYSGALDFSSIPDTSSVNFNLDVVLDTTIVAGQYEFMFIATDNDDNEGTTTWSFNVE